MAIQDEVEALKREVERLTVLGGNQRGVLEAILNHSPHGILACDAEGKIYLQNRSAEQIWAGSATANGVEGWGKYRAFHPDGRPFAPQDWSMYRCLANRQTVSAEEVRFQRFDDSFGTLLGSCAPVFDADGALAGAVSIFADISDLKRVEEELVEKDRLLTEDLLQARAFQQSLLPRIPQVHGLALGAVFEPGGHVGGDIYDICRMEDGRVRIFIVDLTGHGVQAALRTMLVKSEYDRLKQLHARPADVFAKLNQHLMATFSNRDLMCTGLCVDLTPHPNGGAKIEYVSAAHPELMHVHRDKMTFRGVQTSFLGMDAAARYVSDVFEIERGDRLIACSDGFLDQRDRSGKPFAETIYRDVLDRSRSLVDVVDAIMRAERADAPQGVLSDDVTVVTIECIE